jgi:hypothetical protein
LTDGRTEYSIWMSLSLLDTRLTLPTSSVESKHFDLLSIFSDLISAGQARRLIVIDHRACFPAKVLQLFGLFGFSGSRGLWFSGSLRSMVSLSIAYMRRPSIPLRSFQQVPTP